MFIRSFVLILMLLISTVFEQASAAMACHQIYSTVGIRSGESVFAEVDAWIASPDTMLTNVETKISTQNIALSVNNLGELATTVQDHVRKLYPQYGEHELKVAAPGTKPRSGAQVFIVFHLENPIGVFKIFNNSKELAKELISNRILQRMPGIAAKPPKYFEIENVLFLGKVRPAALMEYIHSLDLEALLRKVGKELRSMTSAEDFTYADTNRLQRPIALALTRSAMALAELHLANGSKITAIDPALKDHEINMVQRVFNPAKISELVSEKLLTEKEAQRLLQITTKTTQAYRADTKIPGALTHGDSHPGNIIIGQNSKVHFIDTETLMWSLRKTKGQVVGAGDPMLDVGKFLSAFMFQAAKAGFHYREIFAFTHVFIETYWAKTQFDFDSMNTSLDFYLLRFSALLLTSEHTDGNPIDHTKRAIDLLRLKFPLDESPEE